MVPARTTEREKVSVVLILGMVAVLGAMAAAMAIVVALVVRQARGRADNLRTRWAAIAQARGLAFQPGTAFQDPVLTGMFGGRPVSLTVARYQLGSTGPSYAYTVARAPAHTPGEALIAHRDRLHHVGGVAGADVPLPDPRLAATHVARVGSPALAAVLLAPEVLTPLVDNAVSHLRLAHQELVVQRPGHQGGEAECLALMQLAADLALRL